MHFYFEIHSEITYIHVSGLLTDGINNKFKKSNLIHEHALNREPVPLIMSMWKRIEFDARASDASSSWPYHDL